MRRRKQIEQAMECGNMYSQSAHIVDELRALIGSGYR